MFIDRRYVGGIVALFFAAAGLWIYYGRSQTYEECLVDGMRSQNQSMYLTVQEICSRKHDRVEALWISNYDVNWDYRDFTVTVFATPRDNSREDRTITEGTFQFSSQSCDESKIENFTVVKNVEARKDGSFQFLLPPSEIFSVPKCMRTASLKGKYR